MDAPIHRDVLADIPVYWTDTAPRFMGAIIARVGAADETIVQHGITHLVEHLALFPLRGRTHPSNGQVELIRTVLWATGTPDEVGAFLTDAWTSLGSLPMTRTGDEARVLRTEASGRTPGLVDWMLALRFGATAYGINRFREWGLHRVSGPDAAAWARARFGSGNVALWCSGPLPSTLSLGARPGPRWPPAAPFGRLGVTYPCHASGLGGSVAVAFLAPRTTVSTLTLQVFADRVRSRVRYDLGASYDVSATYQPLDATIASATVSASCLVEQAERVSAELIRAFDELAAEGPTPEEFEQARSVRRRGYEEPEAIFGLLDAAATNELLGAPVVGRDELLAELDAATPAEISSALVDARATLILATPEGVRGPRAFAAYPRLGRDVVPGRSYRRRSERWRLQSRGDRLIVGSEGVSIVGPSGLALTVRYPGCAGMMTFPEGVELVGVDGTILDVAAADWASGEDALARVRAGVPRDLVVRPLPP